MITRSYDIEVLRSIGEQFIPDELVSPWLMDTNNVMLVKDDNIGLATFDFPGMYTVHWFFKVRGREALNLAREMFKYMFDNHNAQVLRGLTPTNLKAARWASRQVGMKSYGEVTTSEGKPHELFIITKDEFFTKDKHNGS